MSSEDENLQVLDVQMRSGKDGYIGIMVGNFSRLAYIIASPEMKPSQMHYMAGLIISMIPGAEIREELNKKRNDKIAEIKAEKIKEGYTENVAKDIAISSASVYIVGEATDFLNQHLGITKEARIEIDFDKDTEEFFEKLEEQKKIISKLENEIKILKEGKK